MGRRGENIHKRGDGRWEARVVAGQPVCGKTTYKSLYARSYKAAKAKKKDYLAGRAAAAEIAANPAAGTAANTVASIINTAVNVTANPAVQEDLSAVSKDAGCGFLSSVEPLPIPAGTSDAAQPQSGPVTYFNEVAARWLASKKLAIKESSYAFYSIVIDKHLLPKFGKLDIKKVNTEQINTFLLEEMDHGRIRDGGPLSDKTISEIKSILNRILRYANAHHLITEVPESMPITVKKKPKPVFTEQEMISIENRAREEDTAFAMSVLLCGYTGIREGEICALQWSDFDWENRTISIRKTVSRISNTERRSGARTRVVVGLPKTECSIRTVPVPESVVNYFKEHSGPSINYVITGTPKYMEPRVCRDRFTRFLRRAGVKHHTFHTLRHSFATNCIEQGMNVKVLSEILGHSDVSITLARYVHPSMESKKAQMNKLKTFANRENG